LAPRRRSSRNPATMSSSREVLLKLIASARMWRSASCFAKGTHEQKSLRNWWPRTTPTSPSPSAAVSSVPSRVVSVMASASASPHGASVVVDVPPDKDVGRASSASLPPHPTAPRSPRASLAPVVRRLEAALREMGWARRGRLTAGGRSVARSRSSLELRPRNLRDRCRRNRALCRRDDGGPPREFRLARPASSSTRPPTSKGCAKASAASSAAAVSRRPR
jgi:hypothetical protein